MHRSCADVVNRSESYNATPEFVSDEEHTDDIASVSITLYPFIKQVDDAYYDQDDDQFNSDETYEPIEPEGFEDFERIHNEDRRELVAFEVVALLEEVSGYFCCRYKLIAHMVLYLFSPSSLKLSRLM